MVETSLIIKLIISIIGLLIFWTRIVFAIRLVIAFFFKFVAFICLTTLLFFVYSETCTINKYKKKTLEDYSLACNRLIDGSANIYHGKSSVSEFKPEKLLKKKRLF